MRDFIADKELSDHQPLQESDALSGSIDAANDDEHEENKKKRSYKKGATLRLDGPIAGLCSLEKGAAYIGLTKSALRVAIHRGQMPGHKTRTNP
ncbi:TPA: transcriptional regulator, partial [Escherichia coli]